MPRIPGGQRKAVLEEKARIARELLAQGLTITQVAGQLNCSRAFVRRIAREREASSEQN